MKDCVSIRSFQSGIQLTMNPNTRFELLLQEIGRKFSEGRSFFGNASIALSFEGRELSEEEETQVLDMIQTGSDLNIICIVGHSAEREKIYVKAIQQVQQKLDGDDEAHFYHGTLKDSDVLEMETSIIIMGDVNPGCVVMSKRSVIVLGGLYGEAYAGEGGYVIALEMAPERLKIGDFKYNPKEKSRWSIHPKIQPKMAIVKNDKITLEPLTKELLDTFYA